jgi:hypothetical protein
LRHSAGDAVVVVYCLCDEAENEAGSGTKTPAHKSNGRSNGRSERTPKHRTLSARHRHAHGRQRAEWYTAKRAESGTEPVRRRIRHEQRPADPLRAHSDRHKHRGGAYRERTVCLTDEKVGGGKNERASECERMRNGRGSRRGKAMERASERATHTTECARTNGRNGSGGEEPNGPRTAQHGAAQGTGQSTHSPQRRGGTKLNGTPERGRVQERGTLSE